MIKLALSDINAQLKKKRIDDLHKTLSQYQFQKFPNFKTTNIPYNQIKSYEFKR